MHYNNFLRCYTIRCIRGVFLAKGNIPKDDDDMSDGSSGDESDSPDDEADVSTFEEGPPFPQVWFSVWHYHTMSCNVAKFQSSFCAK